MSGEESAMQSLEQKLFDMQLKLVDDDLNALKKRFKQVCRFDTASNSSLTHQ